MSAAGYALAEAWERSTGIYLSLLVVQLLLFLTLGLLARWPAWQGLGLFALAVLSGLVVAPVAALLRDAGARWIVPAALVGTAVLVVILTMYVSLAKQDFSGLGRAVTWVLLGLFVLMLANALLFGGALPVLVLDALAVALLCGLILRTASLALWHTGSGAIGPVALASEAYTNLLALFFVLVYLLGNLAIG